MKVTYDAEVDILRSSVVRDAKEVSIIEVTDRARVVVTLPHALWDQIAPRVANNFNRRISELNRSATRNERTRLGRWVSTETCSTGCSTRS